MTTFGRRHRRLADYSTVRSGEQHACRRRAHSSGDDQGLGPAVRCAVCMSNRAGGRLRDPAVQTPWAVLVAMAVCRTVLTEGPALEISLNFPGHRDLRWAGSPFRILRRPGGVAIDSTGRRAARVRGNSAPGLKLRVLPAVGIGGQGQALAHNGHRMILVVGFANAHWTSRCNTPNWRIDKLPRSDDRVRLPQLLDGRCGVASLRECLRDQSCDAR
ncbi:hypothetical protein C8K36_110115 [Rhodococcus sp. OK519]|nr:hypothetical protein C8K36_110115 [Rhodococcus sp. OK519]